MPGPTLRAHEGDLLRIRFLNASAHPHTIHFHGIHPSFMDGVPGIGPGLIQTGGSTVYEFDAHPFGLHLYHCHAARWRRTSPRASTARSSSIRRRRAPRPTSS